MHELGLMQTAVEAALKAAQTLGATRVACITLRVGEASGADPAVLQMGFAALTQNTIAEGAALVIEPVPVACFCLRCQVEFNPARADDLYYECPRCGGFETQVRHGRDIAVGAVEVS
jgi:hydrogenase nickel incorporation protein HypA/HybF